MIFFQGQAPSDDRESVVYKLVSEDGKIEVTASYDDHPDQVLNRVLVALGHTISKDAHPAVIAEHEEYKKKQEEERKRMTPHLCDRGDGCKGHYCIGKQVEAGRPTFHYWNDNELNWCAFGSLYVGEEAAEKKLAAINRLFAPF